jgi:hypothetical protein
MSQEDQVMRNESEQEEAFSGSEDGETGSETEHSPICTKGDGSDRNKFHSSILVQGQTQATDGDGHSVSQARLVGAPPSSTPDVHVDPGQERPGQVDERVLIRQHTETSPTPKTSWLEDITYPLEAMTRFESAMNLALQGGGRSDALVWPWLNRYLGLVLWETNGVSNRTHPR